MFPFFQETVSRPITLYLYIGNILQKLKCKNFDMIQIHAKSWSNPKNIGLFENHLYNFEMFIYILFTTRTRRFYEDFGSSLFSIFSICSFPL